MGPFLIAWLVGMGLNVAHSTWEYRILRGEGIGPSQTGTSPLPPKPGKLLTASGIYVGLAILAEAPSLRTTATLAAWGYNIAIALRWAQEYADASAQGATGKGIPTTASAWWNPPSASGDVLFPNGTGGSPNAKPSSLMTGPGTQVA